MTDTAASASAPIPPSGKGQPDPPTGEEEPDAKKLTQGEESKMINFEEMPELLKYLPESLKDEIPDDVLDRLHLTREDLKVTDDEPMEPMDVALLCTLEAPPGEDDVRDFPEPEKHILGGMCSDVCGVVFDHF
ncbi:PREDICTED: uncharacterized protein LOC101300673 [Fragaria vesca subsp. vesca]|uniref:uncharacterized protein LOC101300673 n=1 Tax=Fragaria vesca subsp. vesca TaxID=101020 RepID=UPI0002C33320|nr:PREDICTED: uncharacterized protein LOC101300673 [Fragaria vesca subsp. vesca]